MAESYQLVVKTNCYAGNFEREMCAYMTGQIGDCEVGGKFVKEEIKEKFEDKISGEVDDNGTFRPVALDDENSDNFVIFLEEKLSKEDVKFLEKRAKLFEKERPYKYLDKKFKFLGLEQIKITTKKERISI